VNYRTKQYRIAIFGAGGLVGQEMLKIMEQRNFPVSDLHLYAVDHAPGKKLYFKHAELPVVESHPEMFSGMDIAFFLGDVHTSRHYLPYAISARTIVIDNTDAWRLEGDVPLIVPEVNPDDMKNHHGVVASPTCTTVPVVAVLGPLHKLNPLKRVIVCTYQSVSGTGQAAMEELTAESRQVLNGQKVIPGVYPHQVAFNLLPEVDVFLDTGYTKEERKIMDETRKILHTPELEMTATCVRVPVFIGHSLAVHVEFTHPFPPDEARNVLTKVAGVKVLDDNTINLYPQPWTAAGTDECFVGRIRKDTAFKNGLAMWIAMDNIRKGAALNAVQIAEEMIKRGWLSPGGIA